MRNALFIKHSSHVNKSIMCKLCVVLWKETSMANKEDELGVSSLELWVNCSVHSYINTWAQRHPTCTRYSTHILCSSCVVITPLDSSNSISNKYNFYALGRTENLFHPPLVFRAGKGERGQIRLYM